MAIHEIRLMLWNGLETRHYSLGIGRRNDGLGRGSWRTEWTGEMESDGVPGSHLSVMGMV